MDLDDLFQVLNCENITIKDTSGKLHYQGSAYYFVKNVLYDDMNEVISIKPLNNNSIEIIIDVLNEEYEEFIKRR